jgi:DcaP outer membrane protein
MKIQIKKVLIYGAALVITAVRAQAQTSDMSELDDMKAKMQIMQTNMNEMQERIDELEKEKAQQNQSSTNVAQPAATGEAEGVASPVPDRGDLNDQQAAAPRLNNETVYPNYPGYVPIPMTPALIQFNAKPRLDMMLDNRNSGNPDRFVTATIPTAPPAQGGGAQYNMTAKGSQLSIDVRAPNVPGDFRFYYQNDFFGSQGGAMPYRLRQLYGQYYNVTAGFTYSIFEDPDVWPDTVDYEGPNSAVFSRLPTVRYMLRLSDQWQLNFGLQQPASGIDNANNDAVAVNHAPDGGVNLRWENSEWGHIQLATIFRCVGANSVTFGNQNVFGAGMNLSTSLNVWKRDTVQGQFTVGQGIFQFCNDNFTYTGFSGGDAAYNNAGQLQAMRYMAPMFGYTHYWSDQFRTTITSGYVNLHNTAGEEGAAYNQTYYGSANIVWQIRKRLSIGVEALYGYKQDKSGANGDVWRLQTGLVYSLF